MAEEGIAVAEPAAAKVESNAYLYLTERDDDVVWGFAVGVSITKAKAKLVDIKRSKKE
jgi:hypothetical protein